MKVSPVGDRPRVQRVERHPTTGEIIGDTNGAGEVRRGHVPDRRTRNGGVPRLSHRRVETDAHEAVIGADRPFPLPGEARQDLPREPEPSRDQRVPFGSRGQLIRSGPRVRPLTRPS